MPKINFTDTEQGAAQTPNSSKNFVQNTDTEFHRNAFLNSVDGSCAEVTPKVRVYFASFVHMTPSEDGLHLMFRV
jgi:hypothetical protein